MEYITLTTPGVVGLFTKMAKRLNIHFLQNRARKLQGQRYILNPLVISGVW